MTQYSDRAPVNERCGRTRTTRTRRCRSLPGSSIKVYKNGELAGTAFDGIISVPAAGVGAGGGGQACEQELDDGSAGVLPSRVGVLWGRGGGQLRAGLLVPARQGELEQGAGAGWGNGQRTRASCGRAGYGKGTMSKLRRMLCGTL